MNDHGLAAVEEGDPETSPARRWWRARWHVPVWILAALAIVFAARAAEPFLAPIVAAVVLATILSPLARFLERRVRLYRAVASAIALAAATAALVGSIWLLLPATDNWQDRLPSLIARAEVKLWRLSAMLEDVKDAAGQIEDAAKRATENGGSEVEQTAGDGETVVVQDDKPGVIEWALRTLSTEAPRLFVILLLAYLMLCERGRLIRTLIWSLGDWRLRYRTARFCRSARRTVTGYFLTIGMINLGLGATVGLAFWIIGMPNPATWAGALALANFVPFVGPAILLGTAFMVGLVTFPSLQMALVPPAIILGLNVLESNLVMPTLVGRRFYVSPVVVLIAISFGGWLWGTLGMILAVPLTVMAISTGDGLRR